MSMVPRGVATRVYLPWMSNISSDDLRKRVEWARNNGKATHEPGGRIRFEHEGKQYVIPAELVATQGGVDGEVELSEYAVPE